MNKMAEIRIIDKVRLSKDGLVVSGSKQLAHLRQGELDGACAVYSMMMCLVIEKIIKRSIITNVPLDLRRNTSDGRLVNHFLEKQGMVVNGYELKDLQEELQSAFKKKVDTVYYNRDDTDIIDKIISCLDDNHPIEICFSRKKNYGHAIVVIGYQKVDNNVRLYCLDPGYPIDDCQLWNNVLDIDKSSTAKFNCYNLREDRQVMIDEALLFLKK